MCFLFAPISAGRSFFLLHISHRLLSCAAGPASSLLKLKNVNYRYRTSAITEAKVALTEYLHSTRALPFSLAEHIASNSPLSLISLVSQIPFNDATPTHFPRILRSFLSYRPVNEFEFFFESIGLPPSHPSLPSRSPLFLSDDKRLLDAVSSLLRFGFPWTLLGILYVECPSIFSYAPSYLLQRLHRFESLGFRRLCVIAICLAFPTTLSADVDDVELRLLFQDLRIILVEYGLDSRAGDDVHVLFRYCRRIRVFYDMGLEKGKLGELMGRNMRIFLEFDESILGHKLGFFLKLGMRKEDVGPLALANPEVFDVDLDNQIIVMPDHLLCVGLSKEESDSLMKKFPHVMGKNKLGNLPALIRALDLRQWLLTKIEEEKNLHLLLCSYGHSDSVSNKMEVEFEQYLDSLKLVKQCICIDAKVNFFLSIGFGKNRITAKLVGLVNGSTEQLQDRFDCLNGLGIQYPKLCRMISAQPKVLNQCRDMLIEKMNYFCRELGCPIDYLDNFPAFLCFDLENRTKPRYRILNWLRDNGLMKKPFAPATVLANSEKKFIFILSCIHPAAPKQWLEKFSFQNDCIGHDENS